MTDIARFSLEDPPRQLKNGAGLQKFRMHVDRSATGSGTPTVAIKLYEGSTLRATVLPATSVSGEMVLEPTWDAIVLDDGDGSTVEVQIEAEPAAGGATVDIYSFRWRATTLQTATTRVADNLDARWAVLATASATLSVTWKTRSFIQPPDYLTFPVRTPERVIAVGLRERTSRSPRAPDSGRFVARLSTRTFTR